jgi:superfamily II DNA/RNA helicase
LEQEIPGEPVLVVTHSKQFALVLAEKLRRDKYTVAEWHGDLKQSERDAEGERFEAGEAQVLVATIASLGTGPDFLQRVTQTIVWMSRTDDPTDNEQTEGRLDRMGSLGRVTSIEIQADGTYDEGIFSKNLQHALDMNKTLAGTANVG